MYPEFKTTNAKVNMGNDGDPIVMRISFAKYDGKGRERTKQLPELKDALKDEYRITWDFGI